MATYIHPPSASRLAPPADTSGASLLPRYNPALLHRVLPVEQRIAIDINGCFAGAIRVLPEATRECVIGWAFLHRFIEASSTITTITSTRSRVSLMVDSGVDIERRRASAVDWSSNDSASSPGDERLRISAQIPRRPVMAGIDAVASIERAFRAFDADDRRSGYVHAALVNDTGILCLARDLTVCPAAGRVIGWVVGDEVDVSGTMLVVRGTVPAIVVDGAARLGIAIVATDAVPTAGASSAALANGQTLIGLAMSYRRGVFVDGGHVN